MERSFEQYFRQNHLPHLWCPGCGNGIAMKAIVQAVTNYTDSKLLAEVSTDLGQAMVGINAEEIKTIMAERGQ